LITEVAVDTVPCWKYRKNILPKLQQMRAWSSQM